MEGGSSLTRAEYLSRSPFLGGGLFMYVCYSDTVSSLYCINVCLSFQGR